ncbi:MAG: OOP family OmpA-OmpF porin [Candidatus Azotimanducaceae bacterium]|jgi:OOP family OmpA-OmpF porin
MSISKIFTRTALAALIICSTATIQAEEKSGMTISPMIGVTKFDDGIGEDPHWSLGLGYQFNNPWAIEFVYSDANADDDRTGVDVDFTRWHLDGLYHLNKIGDYRPYVTFGGGRGEYDFSTGPSDTDTLLNVGVGVKYEFAENTSVRSEFKLFDGNDLDVAEYAFSVGIHHVFAASAPARAAVQQPLDSDNDGVLDSVDQCPTTPAGEAVNKLGCELDSDRDGIADKNDRCPGTTDQMAIIDSKGCYVLITEKVSIELDVEFNTDSSDSRPEHKEKVAKVHKFMQSYPLTKVSIEGHTDSVGKREYNQALSERRAKTVADMLINDFGIEQSRVTTKGFGEDKPIADNSTKAGRQENRRVVGDVEAINEMIKKK